MDCIYGIAALAVVKFTTQWRNATQTVTALSIVLLSLRWETVKAIATKTMADSDMQLQVPLSSVQRGILGMMGPSRYESLIKPWLSGSKPEVMKLIKEDFFLNNEV